MSQEQTLLIVDYNLSRVADVARMAQHARSRHGARTLLIRANPSPNDFAICDEMIDLDPLQPDFVDQALARLAPWRGTLGGGLVFSDNAVHNGARLLERLGLRVDCATLALGAFSKYVYRQSETAHAPLLRSQCMFTPGYRRIESVAELRAFADAHPDGFVVKPSCEGNNRGVVVVHASDDLQAAFDEVSPYLANGVICEQLIPYHREYSYDGIASLAFITEKLSATGRYPVEVAQVLPARLSPGERHTLQRAGHLCNLLVGQRDGPFHNEIRLSNDGAWAAVVEPNRRPAGMKIWSLAEAVHGIDLFALWVDFVLGEPVSIALPPPQRQAATVMLGVPQDGFFAPLDDGERLLAQALSATIARHALVAGQLRIGEFGWLSQNRRLVHATPRDNADFLAQATLLLDTHGTDIRCIVSTLREQWLVALRATRLDGEGHERLAVSALDAAA